MTPLGFHELLSVLRRPLQDFIKFLHLGSPLHVTLMTQFLVVSHLLGRYHISVVLITLREHFNLFNKNCIITMVVTPTFLFIVMSIGDVCPDRAAFHPHFRRKWDLLASRIWIGWYLLTFKLVRILV